MFPYNMPIPTSLLAYADPDSECIRGYIESIVQPEPMGPSKTQALEERNDSMLQANESLILAYIGRLEVADESSDTETEWDSADTAHDDDSDDD
ncbi:hypothetical protein L6452_15059 [Arctium lappa]|uniref:Uncharacterized protein n=1 Tax=Arctium lappa TaxID=4217 RepID=A0ACB9CMU5_ARCLA|nr:hypothetical protein L6452_15059 [Arctium lappa]